MRLWAFNRLVLWQALIVALVLLPLLGGAYTVWTKHQRVQGILAELEPRYARLKGLLNNQARFEAAQQAAAQMLAQKAYPASQDVAKTGNEAQQRIRSLFAESGLDISSIQVLPAKEVNGFDRIGIQLRIEGNLTQVQTALTKLATQSPTVVVETMNLQTIGAVRPASIQRLAGQFVFSVYRVRS
ncbi:MAG: hypothetical protein OHK0048_03760 [Rhodoferax sp.]